MGIVRSIVVLCASFCSLLADHVRTSPFCFLQGVVRIHIIEAKNLEEKDKKVLGFGGKSDPFVTVKGKCARL